MGEAGDCWGMSTAPTPAIFVDRDGTLMEEANYCSQPEQVRIIPGVPEALRSLKEAGFRLVIITNQSGIGRGIFSHADFESFQARLFEDLVAGGIEIEAEIARGLENHGGRRLAAGRLCLRRFRAEIGGVDQPLAEQRE